MEAYQNILIIQTAFIGDAILASSLAEKLHQTCPSARISILVRKGNEGIYSGHPFLHQTVVWDKNNNKSGNLWKLLRRIRRGRYDCVVNCHRYASSGFLTAFSGARHTAGYKENPFSFLFNYSVRHVIGDGRHETERYNELVADFAGNELFKPKLYPSPSDVAAVQPYLTEAYVCMAPASIWFTKQLPEDKWIELCNRVSQTTRIYLIGGAGDAALCERVKAGSLHNHIENLSGKLTLLQSCALMQHASMNYVNDSAPLHLASAVNAPVTVFFCSTVPAFGFGPLSDKASILGLDELPCRPCGLHGYTKCPLGHFKCGNLMPLPDTPG